MPISSKLAAELAKQISAAEPKDHFGSEAFSANKRIFATVWHNSKSVNLRLSLEDQRKIFLKESEGFLEIDNAWGRQGWTKVQLEFVSRKDFEEALSLAFKYSAEKSSPLGKDKNKSKNKGKNKDTDKRKEKSKLLHKKKIT